MTVRPSPPNSSPARRYRRASGLLHLRCKKFSTTEFINISFKWPLRAVSRGKIRRFPLTASKQALMNANPIQPDCDIQFSNPPLQRPKKPKINPSSKRDEDVANAVNLFTTDLLPPSFTMLFTFITSICSPTVCSLHTQRPAGQRNRTAKQ